jgi:hypothetical protein
MKECTITQFRNAAMHPDSCLRRCKNIEFDLESLTRTKYFAECRAELEDESIMVYAPITAEALTMVECANVALPAASNHVSRLKVMEDEMLCSGLSSHYCAIIVEPLPLGISLSEALYTYRYERLASGLEALRTELQRHDISINHLHPDSIIVDRNNCWHVIRPYYATRGFGGDSEAFEKLMELIRRYALSDTYECGMLHEGFAAYGTNGGRTTYPASEGMRRFSTSEGFGFEDEAGNVIVAAIYRCASDFLEDRAVVESHNGKWGVIDRLGRYIIGMEYDYIEFDVDDGTSEVSLHDQTATFDYFGQQLTEWR